MYSSDERLRMESSDVRGRNSEGRYEMIEMTGSATKMAANWEFRSVFSWCSSRIKFSCSNEMC